MHVLYLHQYFVPKDGSGGTRSLEMARRMVRAGHRVTLITSSAFFPNSYHFTGLITRLSVSGIEIRIVRVPYSNTMSYPERIRAFVMFALLACLEVLRVERADVVFATSTPLTIAIPGIVARVRHRCKMVFEVRDLWPELPIAMGALKNPVLRVGARALEKLAYFASERIVALSPGMKEGVARAGYDPEGIVVIPNSCDTDLFQAPRVGGLRLPFEDAGPVVTYAGTFGAINGVEYLVKVASHALLIAPDFRFLLVGNGAMRERVREAAIECGVLGKNLWIIDPVPKGLVPELMRVTTIAASLFIDLPQMWNNSANKFFDGLAAGKPIAINYGGWQAQLLRETGAGIVLPRDPKAAAEELVAFVRNAESVRVASARARELATERFSRDVLANSLIQVLEAASGACSEARTADAGVE